MEIYKIRHLQRGSTPMQTLVSTPIPGEARVPIAKDQFSTFAAKLEETAEHLGGRAVVFLNNIAPFNYSSAIVSWREVRPDDLGSRFVRMEDLKKDIFELETLPARFLLEALQVGAHFKLRDRNIDITIMNYFGKHEAKEALGRGFSREEIGRKYFITRERIRQIVKRTICFLHSNSPDYLKEKYPLAEILKQIERPQFMINPTGTTRKVAEAILQGANYQDLIDRGFSVDNLVSSRRILSDHFPADYFQVPYHSERGQYQSLVDDLKTLKTEDSAERKQQVLDRITYIYMSDLFYKEYKSYLLSVSDLAKTTGLHFAHSKGEFNLILQSLAEAGIGIKSIPSEVKSGKQRGLRYYHSILAVDQDQALKILKNDPSLEVLRREVVQQLCGEKTDQLPTTWELKRKKEYNYVSSLISQLGHKAVRGSNMMRVLDGCPVPIFKTWRRYCYPVSVEARLRTFLKNKLG